MAKIPIQTAAKLLEIREVCRRAIGEKFHDRIAEFVAAIKLASPSDREILSVAMQMAEVFLRRDQPVAAMWVIAAGVEIIDPTPMTVEVTTDQ